MKLKRIGIDLAKQVFQLHGVDSHERVVCRKQLKRSQMPGFFRQLEPYTVAMEACGSAHYWARELRALGHEVRLIAPQFVKPYVKSGKPGCRGVSGTSVYIQNSPGTDRPPAAGAVFGGA